MSSDLWGSPFFSHVAAFRIYKVRLTIKVVVAEIFDAHAINCPHVIFVGDSRGWLLDAPQVFGQSTGGSGRIKNNLGSIESQGPPALWEVSVVTYINANFAHRGVKNRVSTISGPEVKLFPETLDVGNVLLSILAEVTSVSVNDGGGVIEEARACIFIHWQKS